MLMSSSFIEIILMNNFYMNFVYRSDLFCIFSKIKTRLIYMNCLLNLFSNPLGMATNLKLSIKASTVVETGKSNLKRS